MEYSKPKKIFIVDDDPMLTEALNDYLTRNIPHEVHCFGTGEACLQQMHLNPEIVILDYHLNTVRKDAANGMEVLQTIKTNYPKVEIIMLSSQESYLVAMKTLQKGAEQYIIKDKEAFEKIAAIINRI